MENTLINIQLALFFKDPTKVEPSLYISELAGVVGDHKQPLVISVPDKPELNEVPVVQIRSQDEKVGINVSRARADLFIFGDGVLSFEELEPLFVEKTVNLFQIINAFKLPVKRIGFISKFFYKDKNSDQTISKVIGADFKNIMKKGEDVPTDALVRYSQKALISNLESNNLSSLEKATIQIGEVEKQDGLILMRDINTAQDSDYSEVLSIEKLENYIREAISIFDLDKFEKLLW